MLKKNFYKFISFGIVGALAFFLDWIFFNFLFYLTRYFLISLGIAWIISLTFNFLINRNYTFSAKKDHAGKQLLKWLLIHSLAFSARAGIGKGVLFVLGGGSLNANIAFASGLIISIPITFLGSLLWVFKNPKLCKSLD